jgi:hypothetical protein
MPLAIERMHDLKLAAEVKQLSSDNTRLLVNQRYFDVFKTLTIVFLITTIILSLELIRSYFF